MATSSPADALPADPDADRADLCACGEARSARSARRLGVLEELTGIGMDLARDLRRQVLEGEVAGGDVGLAFSRIARAVRQTVALEARLDEDDAARTRGVIHKESVRQLVEQTIEAEAEVGERDEGFDAERLLDDLAERLEDEDELESFERCSISELVERICRDLGVAFAPYLLDETDWDVPVPPARPIRARPASTAPDPTPPDLGGAAAARVGADPAWSREAAPPDRSFGPNRDFSLERDERATGPP